MSADGPGYLRIATEEAFAPPELLAAWREMLDGGGACDQASAASGAVQDRLPLGPAEIKAFFQSNAERVFRP